MLSKSFLLLLKIDRKESISLGQLHALLSEDGPLIIIIFLCIPFLFPVPIPGVSTLFGLAIILFTFGLIFPKRVYLPKFLTQLKIRGEIVHIIGEKGSKFISYIEKFLRPRFLIFVAKSGKLMSAFAIISSAIALALPIPPIIPFTNTLPALAICLLSLSLLMKDGLAAIIGHCIHLASWAYLISVAGVAFAFANFAVDYVISFVNSR